VAEGVFVLIGTLCLLVLFSVSEKSLVTGVGAPSSFQATGVALLAAREWVHGFLGALAFAIGALLYYYALYRSRLIPRWLSGWGLVAAALSVVATVYSGFTQEFGFTTVSTMLNLPIALQEMVLAVWLIVKGFNVSAAPSIAITEGTAHQPDLKDVWEIAGSKWPSQT
jgi:hypothetical protein